jgi:hypothetical protein
VGGCGGKIGEGKFAGAGGGEDSVEDEFGGGKLVGSNGLVGLG